MINKTFWRKFWRIAATVAAVLGALILFTISILSGYSGRT